MTVVTVLLVALVLVCAFFAWRDAYHSNRVADDTRAAIRKDNLRSIYRSWFR